MKIQRAILSIAAAALAVTMGADAQGEEERSSNLSPQVLQEIAKVEAEIDLTEAQTIERLAAIRVEDEPERAAWLLGAAAAHRERLGAPLPSWREGDHKQIAELARRALGEGQYASNAQAGSVLSLADTASQLPGVHA